MIYLIITTCIQNWYGPQNAERRKEEYLSAITETLIHLPSTIQPIIVENNGSRLTYLDEFQHNGELVPVLYTTNNKRYLSHKGMIELLDIKDVIQEYKIKDDDMIIKITGRYTVKSPLFFNRVINADQSINAFIKFYNVCTKQYDSYDSVLGFYACKSYLLRYWSHLTMNDTSPEVAFARHIRRNTTLICEVDWLDIECNFAEENRRVTI
jgi:hypothetical protein